MSGSPVIQNGKLVGAVTHVLVDDPTRGYAIFAENMLETAQGVAEEKLKESNDELLKAHQSQTHLLQEYAGGKEINVEIIMVHAQDHLMTTMTLREVALEMLNLYKKLG